MTVYNILFSGPIFLAFGFFGYDIDMDTCTSCPESYKRYITSIYIIIIIILFLLIVIIFIEPYVFSYKYYFYWVSLALFQGAVEFVVSYLTYSYSYDILSHSGKQTGCEILGIMIISINIWGNLLISSRIYIFILYYYISNCKKMEYLYFLLNLHFYSILLYCLIYCCIFRR